MGHGAIVGTGLRALAPQEDASVIRHPCPYQGDQFRVDWEEGKKGLLYLRSGGMRDEANRMQILTDGA